MSAPIYRFYRVKFTDAWHKLSQEEKERLQEKLSQSYAEQGIKEIGQFRTFWSSEWSVFGLEEFPDVGAVEKWRTTMEQLGIFETVEIESMLGIKEQS